ncbi:class I mannose-6-phosphate isomerase [Coriobacteriales bacterium OH1046]|nr:class I mannose-6-phosphate isomerase [Coriobacteriales bacterium OH1046]
MVSDVDRGPIASDLIFPKPVFVPKIWGGRKLETEFGYDIPDGTVGECWAISAHPNGDCAVEGGLFDGRCLSDLWDNEPELFGGARGDRFPLLIKILDACDYLSVQVHPDDAYAAEHEDGSLGKSECWYILEADPDARIMIGQRAKDRAEFAEMVEQRRWDELLNEIPIRAGDFFDITPGTVHAVKGALILEVQQSSDVTYRVYDFDRRQHDGSLRELHLAQSLDVIDFSAPLLTSGEVTVPEVGGITPLMSCRYFDVERVRVHEGKPVALAQDKPFMCVSVIDGKGGSVSAGEGPAHALSKGSHFVAPATSGDLTFSGALELVVSWANEK